MNIELNNALQDYLDNPKNAIINFRIAKIYEDMGHSAAACSFYIRAGEFAAELENNKLLAYESLLRLGLCLERQGSRVFTVKGVFLRAVSLLPERPEAYFLLSRIYEHSRDWQESYTFAVLGEKLPNHNPEPKLMTNVEYVGKFGFMFEKAVTGWWIGLWDESRNLFEELDKSVDYLDTYKVAIKNNLKLLQSK
jgi:hypothetical protein